MKYFGEGLSELHKNLNVKIRKADMIDEAKQIFLLLHSKLHLSIISDKCNNEVDLLLNDLAANEYAIMPTFKDETIAWVIWHIARIEDLTMNILVAHQEQVFNAEWKQRLNTPIVDTGNALTDDEIIDMNHMLNIKELIEYRNTVGKRTQDIVKGLTAANMRQKVTLQGLEKICLENGVTEQEESIWLLDFWGKKDIAGILLIPPSRHMILHLNDCCKWKMHIRAGKKCYRN